MYMITVSLVYALTNTQIVLAAVQQQNAFTGLIIN